MKPFLLPFLVILLLSCTKENETENIAVIKGKLLSGKVKNVKFDYVVDNPITGYGETYQAKVDSNAEFSIEIPVERLATGRIRAGRFYHEICLMPGDDMYVTIKGDSIGYRGKGAEKNNFLYQTELEGIWIRAFYNEYNEGKLVPEDFLKEIQAKKLQRLQFLENYSSKNTLDKEFIHYYKINNQVIYERLVQGYPRHFAYRNKTNPNGNNKTQSLHKENNLGSKWNLPEEYNKLKQLSAFVDDEKIVSSDYLHNLRNFLYTKAREITLLDSTINYHKALHIVLFDSLSGKSQEYVLAKWIRSELSRDIYDTLAIQKFEGLDNDALSVRTVEEALNKYHEKRALIGQPLHKEFAQTLLSDTVNNKLNFGEMMSRYKGNVVYLDFWAMSCAPCIAAMPYSRKLKEKLGDLPVKFVNLSVDRIPKNRWHKVFETTLTNEHHYVVQRRFDSRLLKFMQINWVPNYMIFDKEGKLVDYNAARPSRLIETKETLLENKLRELAMK